jgi:hypothetical protein
MKGEWFKVEETNVWLTTPGKREFIPRWYDMILAATQFQGRKIKRKDQIQFFLTDLAQSFLPDDEEESR